MPSRASSLAKAQGEEPALLVEAGLERRLEGVRHGLAREPHGQRRARRRCAPASASASRSSASGATTREQMPCCSASRADSVRPPRMTSSASERPAMRGSRCVPPAPGISPRPVSGRPKRAFSAASTMSQVSASSQPPPRHQPCTAAITGSRSARRRCQRRPRSPSSTSAASSARRPATSAPAGERAPGAAQHDAAHVGRIPRRRRAPHRAPRAPRPRARSAPRAGSGAAARRLRDARSGRSRSYASKRW